MHVEPTRELTAIQFIYDKDIREPENRIKFHTDSEYLDKHVLDTDTFFCKIYPFFPDKTLLSEFSHIFYSKFIIEEY